MIYYHNSLSVTSPNTMGGSPTRWIPLIHQLHIAGEEGGSATMVAVFLLVLVCSGWLSHLFELVICRKMVQNGRLSVVNIVTFWPTYACTIPIPQQMARTAPKKKYKPQYYSAPINCPAGKISFFPVV